jgi:hypothetical protein
VRAEPLQLCYIGDMTEDKQLRKEAERAARLRGPLSLRQRIRNQWEALDVARRVIDSLDHSVRYGLIIFSAVNTGAVILLVRPHLFPNMTATTLLVLKAIGAFYIGVALWILFYAIRSLSPRLVPRELARLTAETGEHLGASEDHVMLMSLRPGIRQHGTLAEFHESWRSLNGEQLSRELSEAILVARHMMERKYAVLNRLYPALGVMLLLAALLIIVMASIPGA